MPASALRAHILAFVFLTQALAAPPTAVYLDAWGGVSLTEYNYLYNAFPAGGGEPNSASRRPSA